MSIIGYRLWYKEEQEMIYPVKLSIKLDMNQDNVLFVTRNNKNNVLSSIYMSITAFRAVNGPIYEQDIITNGKITGVVVVDDITGGYAICFKDAEDVKINIHKLGTVKIIGNIYENTELVDKCLYNEEAKKIYQSSENTLASVHSKEEFKEESVVSGFEMKEDDEHLSPDEEKPAATDLFSGLSSPDIPVEVIDEPDILPPEPVSQPDFDEPEDSIADVEIEDINAEDTFIVSTIDSEQIPSIPDRIDIFLCIYTNKSKKSGAYSYETFVNNESVMTFAKYISNSDHVKTPLIAFLDIMKHLNYKGDINIYCNSNFLIAPFEKEMIYKWHDNAWKKNDGSIVSYKEYWEQAYDFAEENNISWHLMADVNKDDTMSAQYITAKNKCLQTL